MTTGHNNTLTDLDRAILEEVGEHLPEGITGRELAPLVGLTGRSIGAHLVSLTKRGLLHGECYAGMTNWFLTPAADEALDG